VGATPFTTTRSSLGRAVRTPDVLPAKAVLVCADPLSLDLSALASELPDRLRGAVEKRQQEFLAGRWCARAALERLGVSPQGVPTGAAVAPEWPAGIVGSITHTRGYAAAAVAHAREVPGLGLDAELVMSPTRADIVRQRLATPRELESVIVETDLDAAVALTLVFSAKEALYKCLFPQAGRVFDYLDVAVDSVHTGSRTFRAMLLVPLSVRWGTGAMFHGRFEIVEDVVHTGVTLS
jgi:enterobactin synthetase component D